MCLSVAQLQRPVSEKMHFANLLRAQSRAQRIEEIIKVVEMMVRSRVRDDATARKVAESIVSSHTCPSGAAMLLNAMYDEDAFHWISLDHMKRV